MQPSARVFAAGTAPFGDAPGQGQERMGPVTFLEGVFCLNAALRRTACPGGAAHLDGLDHHVYSPPWYGAALSTDIGVPDLDRIWRILGKAQAEHTVLPRGAKALWITEIGASATPPTAANFALQAHDLEEDLYEFWSEHVANVFWFSIRDPGLAAGSFFAYVGLFTQSDTPKPAAAAYRFPFVALPHGRDKLTLWGKAPRAGRVLIERRVGVTMAAVRCPAHKPGRDLLRPRSRARPARTAGEDRPGDQSALDGGVLAPRWEIRPRPCAAAGRHRERPPSQLSIGAAWPTRLPIRSCADPGASSRDPGRPERFAGGSGPTWALRRGIPA